MLVEAKSGGFRAVIMDFGLAGFDVQDEAAVEHGSGFSGTIAYAAPERIAGGRATPASDVYSLGLIAHEMLTNRRPIPGVAGASLADGGPLPAAWGKLIRRAIQPDPMARFANGAALAEALRHLNAGAAIAWRAQCDRRADERRRSGVAGADRRRRSDPPARRRCAHSIFAARGGRPFDAGRRRGRCAAASRRSRRRRRRAASAGRGVARVGAAGRRVRVRRRAASHGAGRPSRRQKRPPATTPPLPAEVVAAQRSLIEQAEDLLAGGDIARACEMGEQAVRQAPELAAARAFLGRCYMRLGRTVRRARPLRALPGAERPTPRTRPSSGRSSERISRDGRRASRARGQPSSAWRGWRWRAAARTPTISTKRSTPATSWRPRTSAAPPATASR